MSLFFGACGDCGGDNNDVPDPELAARIDAIAARFAAGVLPWMPDADVLQPRNLYTAHTSAYEWRCAVDDDLDGDGLAFCDDPDCWERGPRHSCTKTAVQLDALEYGHDKCTDGVDNDDDGLIDCDDKNSCACGVPTEDVAGLLIAVAATNDRIVVIFPPEDRAGFDLAVGGLDHPWERMEATDLPVAEVADVVAVGGLDGKVYFALREKGGAETIHLHSWNAEDGVKELNFQREPGSATHASFQMCPDLELVRSEAGLNLFYRHGFDDGTSQLMLARERSGVWTHDVAVERDVPAGGFVRHIGCDTKAAADEFDKLQLLTSTTNFFDGNPPTEGQFPGLIGVGALGFYETGDGSFRAAGPAKLVAYGSTRIEDAAGNPGFGPTASPQFLGFDVDHVDGFGVISGPHVDTSAGVELNERLAVDITAQVQTLRYPSKDQYALEGFGSYWNTTQWGFKFGMRGNYFVAPTSGDRAYPRREDIMYDEFERRRLNATWGFWHFAPAFRDEFGDLGTMQLYPEYARGQRRFDVAICQNQDGALSVCVGGLFPTLFDDYRQGVVPLPWAPEILDSSVENGAVVDPTLGEIELTLDLGGRAQEAVSYQLSVEHYNPLEVGDAVDLSVTFVAEDRAKLALPPLLPDTRYIVAPPFTDPQAVHFVADPSNPPEIRFRTTPIDAADPRDGERNVCEPAVNGLERDEDGYCYSAEELAWGATEVRLPLSFDEASAVGQRPWLLTPQGRRVDGEVLLNARLRWSKLEVAEALAAPGGGCCDLVCNENGACGGIGCAANSETCAQNDECCSGICGGGTCLTCRPVGDVCTGPGDCCTNNCDAGTCAPVACLENGEPCTEIEACCSGNCSADGDCQLGISECVPLGDECRDGDTCCLGACTDIGDGTSHCIWERCIWAGQPCTVGMGRWELHYPEGITNGVGAPIHDDDRVFRFEVEQAPLQFVATFPEDGATNVPTDVRILAYFDGPAIVSADGLTLEDLTNQMTLTTSPLQETPNVWGILHEELSPATSYRFTITNNVRDGEQRAITWGPRSISFETAP